MTLILLADPSITIQRIVELTFAGSATVISADEGGKAVSLAKARHPDIVLCAVIMQKLNGYEVTAALKADESTRSIPVILLTGTMEPFDKKRALQAGAADWIKKPFASHKLMEMVLARTGGAPSPGLDPVFPQPGPSQDGLGGLLKRLFGPRDN
jgi:CheY-like chemotaxis protein